MEIEMKLIALSAIALGATILSNCSQDHSRDSAPAITSERLKSESVSGVFARPLGQPFKVKASLVDASHPKANYQVFKVVEVDGEPIEELSIQAGMNASWVKDDKVNHLWVFEGGSFVGMPTVRTQRGLLPQPPFHFRSNLNVLSVLSRTKVEPLPKDVIDQFDLMRKKANQR